MSYRLNLASKPFTNRALPWAVTAILVFCSLVALGFITRATAEANARAAIVQKDIKDLNQKQLQLLKEAEQVKNSLTPEQQLSLKSAHELVDRKRFSWTRLFADLEGVLPANVRVARIAVRQVHSQGEHTVANLELVVIAKTPTAVTDMIKVMDREGIFQAELRNENLQKGRGESGSEFELSVQYTPRSSFTSASDARAFNDPPSTASGVMR